MNNPSSPDPQAAQLVELLARCELGEEAAFTDLYRATSPKLFDMALRILRTEH